MGDQGRFQLLPWLGDLSSSAVAPHPPLSSAPGMCSVPGSQRPMRSVGPWASKTDIDSCRAVRPGSE